MAYTTIKKPSDYFNTKLYTGNGTTDTAQTGLGFQPDWNWTKQRSSNEWHTITDSVRGITKQLFTNSTQAEQTNSEFIKSFDSDGFTVGTANATNQNTQTYVSWNWKANGAGSANTDGSITSTVSANTTSGFSIVSYTGTGSNATVGHGLGVAPKMVITKSTGAVTAWGVYHQSLGNTDALFLNETTATGANSVYWNNTSPTSSVFSVGSAGAMNNTNGMITYCFAEKQGFSKFGSYVGNGNADGTFVYTGFKPAFILYKATNLNSNWLMYDSKRPGYNDTKKLVMPNLSNAEADSPSDAIDLLSNGFKFRGTGAASNGSGQTFIYMAFAEEPLVGDNPATAR